MRMRCGLWLLPLCTGITILVAIFTCYVILVLKGDAHPLLPSISDAGMYKPETVIFSQLLNIASVLTVVTGVIRYKIVCFSLLCDVSTRHRRLRRLALASCVVCVTAATGVTIAANFPFNHVLVAHMIGALVTFVAAPLYQILDSVLSIKVRPVHQGQCVIYVRVALAAVSAISGVLTAIAIAIFRFTDGKDITAEEILHYPPDASGYPILLTGHFSEWLCVCATCCYFFTYIAEFRNFKSNLAIEDIEVKYEAREMYWANSEH